MDEINTSITMYGKVEDSPEKWWKWYEYSKCLTERLGYNPNYIGIRSDTFKSGMVLTIQRVENRLRKAIENRELIKHLSVYSLPENF